MMVMTAKFNLKKTLMLLAAVAAVILALVLLTGNGGSAEQTSAPAMSDNQQRVKFLKDLGWNPAQEPLEAGPVKMPRETSPVYERYNNLQKSQGYDLSAYAGKKAMRYVYEIQGDTPGGAPILATLLIYGDKIIGGDITDTAAGGKIRGFKKNQISQESPALPSAPTETLLPSEETVPMEAPQ